MEEILHHLRFKKKLVNNGINYLSSGAGFYPSTVVRTLKQTISFKRLFQLDDGEPQIITTEKWLEITMFIHKKLVV